MSDIQKIINTHMLLIAHRVINVFEDADEDATADDIRDDVLRAVGITEA